jgi:hypothetical protein
MMGGPAKVLLLAARNKVKRILIGHLVEGCMSIPFELDPVP